RIAHRLDEAVDECCLELDAGGGVDPPGGDEALVLRLQEPALPVRTPLLGLDLGKGARYPAADLVDARLVALGVFLKQGVPADFLRGCFGNGCASHTGKAYSMRPRPARAKPRRETEG